MRRAVRVLVPLLFVAVMGLLPLLAWLRLGAEPVTVDRPVDGLRSVTWAGAVNDDGRLSVAITYDLADDATRELDIRVPPGARLLTVDGVPIAADIGRYASVDVRTSATVRYELPGAITRYRDGAILALAGVANGSLDSDRAMFPCVTCYLADIGYGDVAVFGRLFVAGADSVELHFLDLTSVRAETDRDGSSVRFAGVDPGGGGVSMVAVLRGQAAGSVDGLPQRDGTVDAAFDALRTDLEAAADDRLRPVREPDDGNPVVAIILTALLGLPVLWLVARSLWDLGAGKAARRASATDAGLLSASTPPDDLPPALAGFVVGDAGAGKQSVIAATILDLARRNVIELQGNDSRRFRIWVPAEARGATGFEDAVIAAMRPFNNPKGSAEVTGPPVWSGSRARLIELQLRRVLLADARKAGLVRAHIPARVSAAIAAAMGVTAIVGGIGLGWVLVFVGPPLALAASAALGQGLSAKGRHERDLWSTYATWLRSGNDHLARAGVHEVATLGSSLVYAAALGGAPVAAKSLSPRGGAE